MLSAINSTRTAVAGGAGQAEEPLPALLHAAWGMAHYGGRAWALKQPARDLEVRGRRGGGAGGLPAQRVAPASLAQRLDEELRAALEVVGWAREQQSAIVSAAATYVPLHAGIAGGVPSTPLNGAPWDAWLHPALAAALAVPPARIPAKLAALLTEEAPGVYTFPALTPAACDMLVEEGRHALDSPAVVAAGAAFNRSHVVMDALGGVLPAFQDFLLSRLLAPAAAMAWPALRGTLDYRYGYIIGYAAAGTVMTAPGGGLLARTALRNHTDDSEVTLNVQLSDGYEGGELVFRGVRGASEPDEPCVLKVPKGTGILHLGQQLHEVTPVTAGQRYAWIVWARSSAHRAAVCPCCLTLRPRGDASGCICDGTLP